MWSLTCLIGCSNSLRLTALLSIPFAVGLFNAVGQFTTLTLAFLSKFRSEDIVFCALTWHGWVTESLDGKKSCQGYNVVMVMERGGVCVCGGNLKYQLLIFCQFLLELLLLDRKFHDSSISQVCKRGHSWFTDWPLSLTQNINHWGPGGKASWWEECSQAGNRCIYIVCSGLKGLLAISLNAPKT